MKAAIYPTTLLLAYGLAFAEPMYVDDKLVLNVYEQPEQQGARIATIETGDVVEALERVDKFMRVQLADGREGWVGAGYLSTEPPAILRLRDLESASQTASTQPPKHLTDEIARLTKRNAALQGELKEIRKQLDAASAAERASANEVLAAAAPPAHALATPTAPIESASATTSMERNSGWAAGWLVAVLAAGAAGFFGGYQTLGRRVRARFGGVKVY